MEILAETPPPQSDMHRHQSDFGDRSLSRSYEKWVVKNQLVN